MPTNNPTQSIAPFSFAPIGESPLWMDAFSIYDNASSALTSAKGSDASQHAAEASFSEAVSVVETVVNAHIAEQIAAAIRHYELEALPDPPRFAAFVANLHTVTEEQNTIFNTEGDETLRTASQKITALVERQARELFADAIRAEKEGKPETVVNALYDEAHAEFDTALDKIVTACEQSVDARFGKDAEQVAA